MRSVCGCKHFGIFEIFCELLKPGRCCRRSFESIEFHAGFRDQFPGASSSLRSEAGLDDVFDDALDKSCDGDVEDELDNPGTTIGTKPSVLHEMFFLCLVHRGRCLRVHRGAFLVTGRRACHREFALSRRDQDREHLCFIVRLHFPRGRHHRCGASEVKSLLPSRCIDAPEPTTNYLSHGGV